MNEVCKEPAVGTATWLDSLEQAIQICQNLPNTSSDEANRGTLPNEVCIGDENYHSY